MVSLNEATLTLSGFELTINSCKQLVECLPNLLPTQSLNLLLSWTSHLEKNLQTLASCMENKKTSTDHAHLLSIYPPPPPPLSIYLLSSCCILTYFVQFLHKRHWKRVRKQQLANISSNSNSTSTSHHPLN